MHPTVCGADYEMRQQCVSSTALASVEREKVAARKAAKAARASGLEVEDPEPQDLRGLQAPENGNCPLEHQLRDVCFPTDEGVDKYERSLARWKAGGKDAPKNKPRKPVVKLARKRASQFKADLSIAEIRDLVEAGVEVEGEPDIGSSGT